jgi:hypothetical protein
MDRLKGTGFTVALSSTGTLSAKHLGPAVATTEVIFNVTS